MKAYLIMYPGEEQSKAELKKGMDMFRLVEHISPNSSIVLTFRNEEEIVELLNQYNPHHNPLFVLKLPGSIYSSHVPADYLEPHSTEHL